MCSFNRVFKRFYSEIGELGEETNKRSVILKMILFIFETIDRSRSEIISRARSYLIALPRIVVFLLNLIMEIQGFLQLKLSKFGRN